LNQRYASRIVHCNALNRRTVADIERKLGKWSEWNVVSWHFHVKKDKKMVAGWRLDLVDILQVFNVRSAVV